MRNILTIALNTFRQTIRDRILYGILVFALIFLGSTVVIGSLSLGEDTFIIKSFGLAGIYLFGTIITIFLGSTLIYEEVEKKSTYLILAKPVRRGDLILGKFAGLLLSVSTTVILMTLVYIGIAQFSGAGFDLLSLEAVILQIFEIAILIALLMLFSVITTPLAATIYTILLLYIGHLLSLILIFAGKQTGIVKYLFKSTYYIFPNLEKFNIRNTIVHGNSIASTEVILTLGYAIIYVVLILYLATQAFNRKEL
jgi:ABC-type transport system involved in multi-copper enzyme maturation permease subunit